MNDWMQSGLGLLAIGVVLAVVGLPLAKRKVRRNAFYGFRIPRTMRDDRIWEPVNAMTGVALVVAGIIAAAVGLLLVVFADNDAMAELTLGIGAPALLLWLVVSIWRGWRLAVAIDGVLQAEARRLELDAAVVDERPANEA